MPTRLQLTVIFSMLPSLGAPESAVPFSGHMSRSRSLCQGTLGRLKFGFRQGRFEVFRARKPYMGRLVHQRARRPQFAESRLITGFDMIRLHLHGGKSRPAGTSWVLHVDWRPCSTSRWQPGGNNSEHDRGSWAHVVMS
eukprot:s2896_g1.t1